MKEPTVRVQKIKKDTIKTRLIIFGALALILLLCSVFCEHLTPYDPYLQNLKNAKAPPADPPRACRAHLHRGRQHRILGLLHLRQALL